MVEEESAIVQSVEIGIHRIIERLSGTIGIAAKTLDDKTPYLYNARMIFPAASTIKIHILIELFNQISRGQHKLDELIEIPTDRVGEDWGHTSSGVLKELESVKQLSLKDAATLMIIVSDNLATNLLIDLLGMESIQDTIGNLGLRDTRLQRRMMDLGSAARGLENLSSPYDMMVTLQGVVETKILNLSACNTILDILSRTQDVLGLRRLIPENVMIEHKTGEIFDVCNDVGIVRVPDNPVILCVMTRGSTPVQRWDTIAEIGRLFYDRLSTKSRDAEK